MHHPPPELEDTSDRAYSQVLRMRVAGRLIARRAAQALWGYAALACHMARKTHRDLHQPYMVLRLSGLEGTREAVSGQRQEQTSSESTAAAPFHSGAHLPWSPSLAPHDRVHYSSKDVTVFRHPQSRSLKDQELSEVLFRIPEPQPSVNHARRPSDHSTVPAAPYLLLSPRPVCHHDYVATDVMTMHASGLVGASVGIRVTGRGRTARPPVASALGIDKAADKAATSSQQ